jgi:hypothetical protein
MADKNMGELTAAANELETALERFDRIAVATARLRLSSQRDIERAAQAVTEAAGCQPEIGAAMQRLVTALNGARDRNATVADALTAFGERVRQKSEACAVFVTRYAQLGEEARAMSESAAGLGLPEAATLPRAEKVARLATLEARMSSLVENAAELHRGAGEADFDDVAKQAESLRQQVLAARNKVTLLRKKLEGGVA